MYCNILQIRMLIIAFFSAFGANTKTYRETIKMELHVLLLAVLPRIYIYRERDSSGQPTIAKKKRITALSAAIRSA